MANRSPIKIATDFAERYPDASARATECAMNLVFTADVLVKRIADLLQPFSLSPASGLVLGVLADSESALPPNEIAERLIISRATMTGLLDSLERRGFVRRKAHPSDRRMLLIELTGAGRRALAFRPVVHRHQKHWLGVLSESEQEQLIDLLHKVQVNLTSPGSPDACVKSGQ